MQNKKGQGLSTNAIILIVLGVVVLIVLIIGFTVGWKNIAPWLSSDNVDTIVNQCEAACTTDSKYDYCTKTRVLKAEGVEVETNCAVFSVISEYSQYGIGECPLIDCEIECESIQIGETTAAPKDECRESQDDVTSIADVNCCISRIEMIE